MKDGKSAQDARCIKSRIMNKVIDYVLSIDTFEQKCVVLKGMLHSPRLKDHVQTNGGLKEARYEDDNILFSDSTLCSLFPSQIKKMSPRK